MKLMIVVEGGAVMEVVRGDLDDESLQVLVIDRDVAGVDDFGPDGGYSVYDIDVQPERVTKEFEHERDHG